jgi:hypothetical protein
MSRWNIIHGYYPKHEHDNLFITDFIQSFINAGNKVSSVRIDGCWMAFDIAGNLYFKHRY